MMLGHLTHTKDIPHEMPEHGSSAISMLQDFHNLRQGLPSPVSASLKHDGGSSIHVGHDRHGVWVSDKHRIARGIQARTPEEVKQHFGQHPEYAEALTHVLNHGHEVVPRGKHLQGDLLFTPGDKNAKQIAGTTAYTPNRITYKAKTKAPVGVAFHTEVTKGVAHSPTEAPKSSPNIFVPQHEFTPDPKSYSEKDRQAVNAHLSAAKELMNGHTRAHLTGSHIQNFTIYNNRATRRDEEASVPGYIKHLHTEGQKAAAKLSTEIGKKRKLEHYNGLIQHVRDNAHHFNTSLKIRNHLEAATNHLLQGVSHPDLSTKIDGKTSPGEGLVLGYKDSEGRTRPTAKLVPRSVTHALGNNPRFPRPE